MSDFAAVCYCAPNEGDVFVDVKFKLNDEQAIIVDKAKADQLLNDFPDWFEAVDMDCDAVLKEETLLVNEPFDYPLVVEGVAPSKPEPTVAVDEGAAPAENVEDVNVEAFIQEHPAAEKIEDVDPVGDDTEEGEVTPDESFEQDTPLTTADLVG